MDNEYRLIGVPGAGKTTTLKRRIEKLVKVEGYDPSSIITTSFSKAGAREIAGRVELPEENTATLHAFAFRALGLKKEQVADGSAANLKAWGEAYPLYTLSAGVDPTTDLQPVGMGGKTLGDELMARYQWLRARMLPRESWPQAVQAFAQAWEDYKAQGHLYDFTDMIEMVDGSMLPPAAWLFVDEAQDMSPLELRLVRDWGRYCEKYILAGDPNQAIYHFKGADGQGFYNPPIPPERTHILKRSWRLPSSVAQTAQRWQTFPTPVEPQAEGGQVEYGAYTLADTGIINQVEQVVSEGQSVMLLASAGYLLQSLVGELRARALPFWNPYQTKNGAWNPLTPQRLTALDAWLKGRADLSTIWKLAEHLPAAQVYHRNRKGLLGQAAKSQSPAPADWDNLTYYFPESIAQVLMSRNPSELLNLLALGGDKTRGLRYTVSVVAKHGVEGARQPRVIVGTIHSVKGGEADHVWLWPDLSPAARDAWASSELDRAATQRAFYVGMTRARHALHLGAPTNGKALDWVLDAPAVGEVDDVITL